MAALIEMLKARTATKIRSVSRLSLTNVTLKTVFNSQLSRKSQLVRIWTKLKCTGCLSTRRTKFKILSNRLIRAAINPGSKLNKSPFLRRTLTHPLWVIKARSLCSHISLGIARTIKLDVHPKDKDWKMSSLLLWFAKYLKEQPRPKCLWISIRKRRTSSKPSSSLGLSRSSVEIWKL